MAGALAETLAGMIVANVSGAAQLEMHAGLSGRRGDPSGHVAGAS